MQPISDENRKIVLASGSPRRLTLMRRLGFEPVVKVSDVPERQGPGEQPRQYASRLAGDKAQDVATKLDGTPAPSWVLAADTLVLHQGDVLEKPADREDAIDMLERLSGGRHEVITAFTWLHRAGSERVTRVVEARVEFAHLDDSAIRRYVDTGEPFDKAGGYGIQDIGSAFVRSVEGSYFAVVGLPVCEVVESLRELGGLVDFPFTNASRGPHG